jgi:hypothetical protein
MVLTTDLIFKMNLGPYIFEGGAAGHMQHPWDNKSLTFADMKEIVKRALTGKLDLEKKVSEKLDGQALAISWKNGKLIASRNKGQTKNFGENALDLKGVEKQFAGRGDLSDAFTFAMRDLQNAIKNLSDKQKQKVFAEGRKFMNIEIMYPPNMNVIPQDRPLLVFHGVTEYNEAGEGIASDDSAARMLAGMIKQIDANVQKTYEIQAPNVIVLPKLRHAAQKQSKYFAEIDKLRNKYKLKDKDQVFKYHNEWWKEFILKGAKGAGYSIPDNILNKLIDRWANNNKGAYKVITMKKEIDNEKFLAWVMKTDKEDLPSVFKQNIKPFEMLFLRLGADVLDNISGVLAANPDETARQLRSDLEKSIADLRKSGDIKQLSVLDTQLKRLEAIGGMDKIFPTEGIVFTYKGAIFKLTGSFAPINAIMGIQKYGR